MGLDDTLKKAGEAAGIDDLGAPKASAAEASAASAVGKMLDSEGVKGVLDKFDAAGLGDKVRSWVSTGENQQVSKEEVKLAMGQDKVAEMAREAGEDEDGFVGELTEALPKVIDKVTPDGGMPDLGDIKNRLSKLF